MGSSANESPDVPVWTSHPIYGFLGGLAEWAHSPILVTRGLPWYVSLLHPALGLVTLCPPPLSEGDSTDA